MADISRENMSVHSISEVDEEQVPLATSAGEIDGDVVLPEEHSAPQHGEAIEQGSDVTHIGNGTAPNEDHKITLTMPHNLEDTGDERVPLTCGTWAGGSLGGGDGTEDPPKKEDASEQEVTFDVGKDKLLYRISDNPAPHLTLFFAFQQSVLSLSSSLMVTLLVAEVACARDNEYLKNQILSSALLMIGISTFVMSTFGVRLPIYQGPASTYLIPLLAFSSMDEWKCPTRQELETYLSNSTNSSGFRDDELIVTPLEFSIPKLQQLQGALILSGVIHSLVGLTGLVGFVTRFVGPVTVVPVIVLVGLYIYEVTVRFSETHWGVACLTAGVLLILSMYLEKRSTPIPSWSKEKGFHVKWFPFHKLFAVLIAMLVGWFVSWLLTVGGMLSSDQTSKQFYARTDSRTHIIYEAPWFQMPYPGQFGTPEFNVGAFISFMVATFMSVLDSIGDYSLCARICRVPHPPSHAFNRGIAVEGLMSALSGSLGIGHSTVSYGGNIAVVGITKVASRRVFQVVALIYIVFAVLGKVGAVFITVPYSVLGGVQIIYFGMFIGMVLTSLQYVDLKVSRNVAIIGIAIFLGLMISFWIKKNPEGIQTGSGEVNRVVNLLLSNPAFVGGFTACFLDNTVPGTRKERGLLAWQSDLTGEEEEGERGEYEEGPEVYEPPFIPQWLRRSFLARVFPIFPPPAPTRANRKIV